MKLAELKNRFQNRYVIRIVAGVLTVTLLGSGIFYAGRATIANAAQSGAEESTELAEDVEGSDEEGSLNLEDFITTGEKQAGKEETVYLISDADGTVTQTIVMEHLVNENGDAILTDATTLSDIQNVKGNETFTQDGQTLTWQADGNDIYYRGTTKEQTPVTQQVTYYLDGEEIAPEELAGKSGRITIRFDYENHAVYTEEINGENIEVKVPFAAITGLVLDDGFSNIEVTNGKIKNNGDSSIVMGYALPGLAESLQVEESDFSEKIDLPDYFEVSADVENFSLNTAMTFVVNAAEVTNIEGFDTADLDEKIEELSDASGQLEDGSQELADGLDTLKNSLGDFSDGMKALSSGLTAYTDGSQQINGGILQVKDGVDLLAGGKDALSDGISQLKDGSASAAGGANALVTGCNSLYSGTKELNSGAAALSNGASALASGATTLASGAADVDSGANELAKGADQVDAGASALADGITQANSGANELAKGADQVNAGAADLAVGAAQLDAGVDQLVEALGEMSQELANNEAAILSQFQTDAVKGLLAQLDVKYADGVTAENLAEVTKAVAQNEETIVGTLLYMGYDQATAQGTYDNLLSGLYQAQGAISVLASVSEKLGSNASNIQALAAGSESLKQGAAQLSEGTSQLSQGAAQLSKGTSQLNQGAAQLSEGTSQLSQGAAQLSEGTSQLSQGAEDLSGGASELKQGAAALSGGTAELQDGAKQVYDGNNTLAAGLGTLDAGLGSLAEKVPALTQGITALQDGVNTLAVGSNTLVANNPELLSGMQQLINGTGQIAEGVGKLDDGSHELADGMQQFNEEAIEQLVNSYNGDVKSLTNRLQAVMDAGNAYQTYTALADGTTGSVKFIYKLAAVKAE